MEESKQQPTSSSVFKRVIATQHRLLLELTPDQSLTRGITFIRSRAHKEYRVGNIRKIYLLQGISDSKFCDPAIDADTFTYEQIELEERIALSQCTCDVLQLLFDDLHVPPSLYSNILVDIACNRSVTWGRYAINVKHRITQRSIYHSIIVNRTASIDSLLSNDCGLFDPARYECLRHDDLVKFNIGTHVCNCTCRHFVTPFELALIAFDSAKWLHGDATINAMLNAYARAFTSRIAMIRDVARIPSPFDPQLIDSRCRISQCTSHASVLLDRISDVFHAIIEYDRVYCNDAFKFEYITQHTNDCDSVAVMFRKVICCALERPSTYVLNGSIVDPVSGRTLIDHALRASVDVFRIIVTSTRIRSEDIVATICNTISDATMDNDKYKLILRYHNAGISVRDRMRIITAGCDIAFRVPFLETLCEYMFQMYPGDDLGEDMSPLLQLTDIFCAWGGLMSKGACIQLRSLFVNAIGNFKRHMRHTEFVEYVLGFTIRDNPVWMAGSDAANESTMIMILDEINAECDLREVTPVVRKKCV